MFNNYSNGSYLIWKLPEERVFIDSRVEAYPVDFLQKVYVGMQEDPVKWELYSKQYNINFIFYDYFDINDYSIKFLKHISSNEDWPLIYKDAWAAIYVRRTVENNDIIKKYEIKSTSTKKPGSPDFLVLVDSN